MLFFVALFFSSLFSQLSKVKVLDILWKPGRSLSRPAFWPLGLDVLLTRYITLKRGGKKSPVLSLCCTSRTSFMPGGKGLSPPAPGPDDAVCFPCQSAVLVHQGSDWLLWFKDVSLCVIDLPNSRRRCGPFGLSIRCEWLHPLSPPPTPDYTSLISHCVLFLLERSMDRCGWKPHNWQASFALMSASDSLISAWRQRRRRGEGGAAGSWVLVSGWDLVFGFVWTSDAWKCPYFWQFITRGSAVACSQPLSAANLSVIQLAESCVKI